MVIVQQQTPQKLFPSCEPAALSLILSFASAVVSWRMRSVVIQRFQICSGAPLLKPPECAKARGTHRVGKLNGGANLRIASFACEFRSVSMRIRQQMIHEETLLFLSMYMHEMLYRINRQGSQHLSPSAYLIFSLSFSFLKGQRRGRESPTCHILPLIGPEADTK